MGKSIVITSGKGGVGKTTVTANLGLALSFRGKKVVLIEGDIGLNNLDVVMRIEEKIIYDIGDVVRGKARILQCLVKVSDNLYVLPATTSSNGLVTCENFFGIVNELKNNFQYVLIDSPAGIEDSFHRAVSGADEALIVTTPHISSIRDGYKASKLLISYNISKIGLIINRMRGEYVADNIIIDPAEIAKSMKIPLCGVLPEEDYVNLYGLIDINDKKSNLTYSFSLLAEYIDGEGKKIFDCAAQYNTVMQKIKRLLR